jgi:hypothetical protein
MSKVDIYVGEYLTIDEATKEERDRLASTECVIGMQLTLDYLADKGGFRVVAPSGASLGIVYPKNKLRLQEALENKWTYRAWLSLVYYNGEDKTYHGEIAYVFYNLKPDMTEQIASFNGYIDNVGEAIKAGKRPKLALTGTQYDEVLASHGTWKATEEEPLPISTKRGSNTVIFKKRMSLTDKLAAGILERKPGPIILSIVLIVAVIALIVFLVYACVAHF